MAALLIQEQRHERDKIYGVGVGGSVVLRYRISAPLLRPQSYHGYGVGEINAYYARISEDFMSYCETTMYEQAAEIFTYSAAAGNDFKPFECRLSFTVHYNENNILSLSMRQYERAGGAGGAGGSLYQYSDTWNVFLGNRINLSTYFSGEEDYKSHILDAVNSRIGEELQENPGGYFDNYEWLTREHFNNENFYGRDDGLAFYYQENEIAPRTAGIPAFTIKPGEAIS